MHFALDCLYLLGGLLASPWLAWRRLRGRGGAAAKTPAQLPEGAVWLHGASVGELALIRPLIECFERVRPGQKLLISSHTATGLESARRAYPAHDVFRLPFDWSWRQRRLMARLKPRLVVVVESDFWPNHLLAAEREAVPVAVINAKLSQRSFRLHRLTRIVPRALKGVARIAAQTEAHAERFRALGVPAERIAVTGNMKYDLTADGAEAAQREALRHKLGFDASAIVIIGGSLHPGEDRDLIAAFAAVARAQPSARLIVVPRYPDQAPAVLESVRSAGFAATLKSELDREPGRTAEPGIVIVVDTLGELRSLYAAAEVAFVGGSLYYRGSNKGGHNLMEPAILGLPVIFGPHNFSFRETVTDLLAADAGIEVRDQSSLAQALEDLVASAERRTGMGRRAREVVLAGQGASARNFALLLPLIEEAPGCSATSEAAQCRHQTRGQLLNE
jgi:3-deoxy-D-manno-octulosonic-acid transferase